MSVNIHLQRVYDAHPPFSHPTFLVDRLWPRGVRRERLDGVCWLKDAAPSTALRQAFHAQPEAWEAFVDGYRAELAQQTHWRAISEALAHDGEVTLLYASKETQRNHAQVLRDFLLEQRPAREAAR